MKIKRKPHNIGTILWVRIYQIIPLLVWRAINNVTYNMNNNV